MAFFDDFKAKAKVFANAAGEKAKDLSDSAKNSASIMSEQREIEKNYKIIGEWFVNEFEGDIPPSIADVVSAVKASQEKIAELRAAREQEAAQEEPVVDMGKICPKCGQVSNGAFCPQCGASMDAEPVAEVIEEVVDEVKDVVEDVVEEITD